MSGTITLLISFFEILKKHTYESQNTRQFFCLSPFSNIKKSILTNLKIPDNFFAYALFQILKKHTYESQNA